MIEPLLYEAEAARLLGIEPRSLRSERVAGRIGYRRVAGRIMYRADDLSAWQERIACPAREPTRTSGAGTVNHIKAAGPPQLDARAQGLALKEELVKLARAQKKARRDDEALN